ncbi:nickel-type superoxide dismutase maturation protease [Streptomyces sp. SID11385]|nr:nickel-type superoxide dismutase maturation protease [Streptomyces sp. SID11385]
MSEAEGRVRIGESRIPLGVAEVRGPSMLPTLRHGDRLLVRYGARVKPGDVVVLRHPFQQDLLIVKRAAERRGAGWWVLADNPWAGGDSNDYGVVPQELVLGRVLGRYRPRRPESEDRLVAATASGAGAGGADAGGSDTGGAGAGLAGGGTGPSGRDSSRQDSSGRLATAVSFVRWGLGSVRSVSGSAAARRLRAR